MRDGGAVFLAIVTRLMVEDVVSYVSVWPVCHPVTRTMIHILIPGVAHLTTYDMYLVQAPAGRCS
jgi:hypothetical protein